MRQLRSIIQKADNYLSRFNEEKELSVFEAELKRIDEEIGKGENSNIPQIFGNLPLSIFGNLLLDIPQQYSYLKNFFPSMPAKEVQNAWTGTHGKALLEQSVVFIKTILLGYTNITNKSIEDAVVLDYGCGWGRLIRLLYKFVPIKNIYGVDPWDESIKNCKECGVKGNLAISDYLPLSLPFKAIKFDLIFAFSVFTHLSKKTTHIVLALLRKYISEDGVLIITIRPKEYWNIHKNGAFATEMLALHNQEGFTFLPHDVSPVGEDITYGDTSMSLAYIKSQFPQWKVEAIEWNEIDPYQLILFLKPAFK